MDKHIESIVKENLGFLNQNGKTLVTIGNSQIKALCIDGKEVKLPSMGIVVTLDKFYKDESGRTN